MAASDSRSLPQVLSALERLTEEELAQLNQVVVARLRLMHRIREHGHMTAFRLGQHVEFSDRGGRVLRGVVTRHNSKSVTVIADNGVQWRVAPSLLREASPAGGDAGGPP